MMFKKKDFADSLGTANENTKGGQEMTASAPEGDEKTKIIAVWQRDAHELRHLVPDFDLKSAISDKAFYDALLGGATVIEAYKKTLSVPKHPQREEIHQNAQSERRGTGSNTVNPAKLSDKEFRKYIENIRNC